MALLSLATCASAQWSLTGNNVSGTHKFLGSTNAKDLITKTDNIEALRIEGTTGAGNH